MANRRMFSGAIVSSARFLQMGQTARLLYYDLGMHADDSGIVEAFTVMRMTGASEDDLRLLAAKGFIVILNADLVTYICDWKANNMIRSDRRQPSMYEGLLSQFRSGELIPFLCAADRLPNGCQPDGNQLTTSCQPSGNQLTTSCQPSDNQTATNCQPSIGKDSIGKVSIEEDSAPPHVRHRYGRYQNVYLTDEEMDTLRTEFPNDWQQRIEAVSEYVASSGKHYKNFLAVIRTWARKEQKPVPQIPAQVPPVYDLEGAFT